MSSTSRIHPKSLRPVGKFDLNYWRSLQAWGAEGLRKRGWRAYAPHLQAWEAATIVLDLYAWREEKPKVQLELL